MLGCPYYTSSVQKTQQVHLCITVRHSLCKHSLRPAAGLYIVALSNILYRPLGAVCHEDARVANQAPRGVVLRAPEFVGLFRRVGGRYSTVGPRQPALGGLVVGAAGAIGRVAGEDAAFALDHNVPRLARFLGNQRHAACPARVHLGAHPLSAYSCLAEAATRQH